MLVAQGDEVEAKSRTGVQKIPGSNSALALVWGSFALDCVFANLR